MKSSPAAIASLRNDRLPSVALSRLVPRPIRLITRSPRVNVRACRVWVMTRVYPTWAHVRITARLGSASALSQRARARSGAAPWDLLLGDGRIVSPAVRRKSAGRRWGDLRARDAVCAVLRHREQ